jgi:transcriptional regulator with XRE-family HTH domain
MPAIESHPLRIARLSAGLSAQALADELGASRGLVTAIEEGRVKTARPQYIKLLAERNQMAPDRLQQFYDDWRARFDQRMGAGIERLTPRARAVLQLSPGLIARYPSFTAWRREFSRSTAGFASLLMVSATSLARYERGESPALPKPLVKAFVRTLGMDAEYLQAVMDLPVTYQAPPPSRSRRRKKEAPDAETTRLRAAALAEQATQEPVLDDRDPVGVTTTGATA